MSDTEVVRLEVASAVGEFMDIFACLNVSRMLDLVHQFIAMMPALPPDVILWSLSSLIGSSLDTHGIFDDIMRMILQFAGKSLIDTPDAIEYIMLLRIGGGNKVNEYANQLLVGLVNCSLSQDES
jgi:hypothetical protein